MSDTRKPEPDEDLLEFLGGIDALDEDTPGEDFADFLAHADIDRIADAEQPPKAPPAKDEKPHE
jgi:hypothetical protein